MKLRRPVLTVVVGGLLFLVAAIAIWRMSVNSANKDRLRAITARGEPVDVVALDKFYSAVPDGSNAALVWLRGAAAMSGTEDALRKVSSKWNKPLTPEHLEVASEVLSSNKEALAIFRRAAALPCSRYPVVLSQTPHTNFQYLADVKGAAQLLRMAALVAAQQGDSQAASDAVTQIFAAGNSFATEPLLLPQLVRFSIDTIAVLSLQCVVNRTSFEEAELEAMQAAAAKADNSESLRLALLGERATFITFVRDPQKALAADPMFAPSGAEDVLAETFLWPLARAVGFWQRDLRFGIDALTTNVLFARLASPQRFYSATNAEAIGEQARAGQYILTALLLPALQKAFARDAFHSANTRNSLVALAVERFRVANNGKLPEDVLAIVPAYIQGVPLDPFDGKLVRYKRTEKGYVVYCIGPDEKDDGGTEKVPNAPKGAPEDVTFIVERAENR